MRTLGLFLRLPAVLAALIVHAACSGPFAQNTVTSGVSQHVDVLRTLALTRRGAPPSMHAASPMRSWLDPAAKKSKALIYLSDAGNGYVRLFDYHTGKQLGYTGGLYLPYGACSDKRGNAYVADFDAGITYEFKHGTTTVVNQWNSNGEPIGCSVNPRNGDLAITNFFDFSSPSGTGSVVVFPGGSQSGTAHYGPGYDWPAGYDAHGNLFVQADYGGQCASGPCLAELPAGGSTWSLLNISGAQIYLPAAVEWDGKYLGVGDQEGGGAFRFVIYQMSVSGSTATVVSMVSLSDGCNSEYFDSQQWAYAARRPNDLPVKYATQVVAGASFCDGSQVGKWAYPRGGDPVREITVAPNAFIDGATIVTK